MKVSVKVIRNILANWGNTFIGTIIGFLMMPFVIHQLGDVKYGIWVLIMSFTGYLGLFDFGVGGSVVKYVAQYKASDDNVGLNEICSVSFYLRLVAGLLAFIVSVFIAFFFLPLFKLPLAELSEARFVMIIVGLNIGLTLPLGFFSGFMRGIQRYDLIAFIQTGVLLVRTLAIVIFLLHGYGLLCLAFIHLASSIVAGIVRIVYVRRTNPELRLKIVLINREKIRMVGHYSLFLFLYFMATRLIFSIDSLIIGYALSAAMVTFYAVPQRLVYSLRLMIMSTGVLQPTVSHLDAQGEKTRINNLLINGTKYSLMIALPVGFSFLVVGREFVGLWIGPKYSPVCYPVLCILTVGILAFVSQHTSTQVLLGLAKHKIRAYTAICEAVANLLLTIVLVRKTGIMGPAIGTAIPMICVGVLVVPWYTCRVTGLSWPRLLTQALVKPISAALLFAFTLYGIVQWMPIKTWATLVIDLSVGMASYVVFCWFICLSKYERINRFDECRAALRSMLSTLTAVLSPTHLKAGINNDDTTSK